MTVKNRSRKLKRTKPNPKPIIEDEGDFYLETPEFPSQQDFQVFNQSGEILRGVFYADSGRSYVYLHRHENIEDIISTCEHEGIHAAIERIREWELDDLLNDKMISKVQTKIDDREEHNMIRIALQEEEYFGE